MRGCTHDQEAGRSDVPSQASPQRTQNEATDFTPWLAEPENIQLLGDTIGLELAVESVEKEVGRYFADILCKETSSDRYVVVENQVERIDHDHLGKTITYAAGLGATAVVWVARHFTDEHRAAFDWLNEITRDDVAFFGLEIEAWQIGDSPAASPASLRTPPLACFLGTAGSSLPVAPPMPRSVPKTWNGAMCSAFAPAAGDKPTTKARRAAGGPASLVADRSGGSSPSFAGKRSE